MRISAVFVMVLCAACHSPNQEWPPWPPAGPIVVSRPAEGVAEYYVEMKPGYDQLTYAKKISKSVNGKVGYVYHSFNAFTIYDISEADVEKIRRMPEVNSVTKSGIGYVALEAGVSSRGLYFSIAGRM